MPERYISPIPTETVQRYSHKVGDYIDVKVHLFPKIEEDGKEMKVRCKPATCRECWREANWDVDGNFIGPEPEEEETDGSV